jgi:hypothetical protein
MHKNRTLKSVEIALRRRGGEIKEKEGRGESN